MIFTKTAGLLYRLHKYIEYGDACHLKDDIASSSFTEVSEAHYPIIRHNEVVNSVQLITRPAVAEFLRKKRQTMQGTRQ